MPKIFIFIYIRKSEVNWAYTLNQLGRGLPKQIKLPTQLKENQYGKRYLIYIIKIKIFIVNLGKLFFFIY